MRKQLKPRRRPIAVFFFALAALLGGAASAVLGVCGPFTDVSDAAFCPFVLEIFTLGITTGTSPTTYDPGSAVTRLQMAAFLSRSVDSVLQRGNRRALVKKFWMPQNELNLGLSTLPAGSTPFFVASDGKDVWVPSAGNSSVLRLRASDGRLLETWTGATGAVDVLIAMGRVFVPGGGKLYRIDPGQAAGAVTTVATLAPSAGIAAFDGGRIWVASASDSSVSIVTPGATLPWTVTTVTSGYISPDGLLFDGSNIWVADQSRLLKVDGNGAILQTVTVGILAEHPVFDGTNIWVPDNFADSVVVVRAATGAVLATLTGNGLSQPHAAAFDGQRVAVTNGFGGDSLSLWKSADLTPIGSFSTGAGSLPFGVCSDGIDFWIALKNSNQLARF
jgi:hypothetical protein